MNKLEKEPAFPSVIFNPQNGAGQLIEGISKRFYAASAAMQGLLANSNYKDTDAHINKEHLINLCYEIADELLKQENE